MSKKMNKVVTYLCSNSFSKISKSTIANNDFLFLNNGDGTYDILKNRWNGVIKKGVNWADCMELVNNSQRYINMQKD